MSFLPIECALSRIGSFVAGLGACAGNWMAWDPADPNLQGCALFHLVLPLKAERWYPTDSLGSASDISKALSEVCYLDVFRSLMLYISTRFGFKMILLVTF